MSIIEIVFLERFSSAAQVLSGIDDDGYRRNDIGAHTRMEKDVDWKQGERDAICRDPRASLGPPPQGLFRQIKRSGPIRINTFRQDVF